MNFKMFKSIINFFKRKFINYLYLPFDKIMNRNLGFSYINIVNYKNLLNLYKRLTEYNIENHQLIQPIEIFYSKI